jgi:hypothetical protein
LFAQTWLLAGYCRLVRFGSNLASNGRVLDICYNELSVGASVIVAVEFIVVPQKMSSISLDHLWFI